MFRNVAYDNLLWLMTMVCMPRYGASTGLIIGTITQKYGVIYPSRKRLSMLARWPPAGNINRSNDPSDNFGVGLIVLTFLTGQHASTGLGDMVITSRSS